MNKKNITLIVIAVVTLLTAVALATYAYFAGIVNVNNEANVTASTGPTAYWFDSTNCTESNSCVYGAYPGTTIASGPAINRYVYIGQDSSKYYVCAAIQAHEVCLSQPYTQYGLEGYTACDNSDCYFTDDQGASAANAIEAIFNYAGITDYSCGSSAYSAYCYVGDMQCGVDWHGNVYCYDNGDVSGYCYVNASGDAYCV